MDDPVESAKRMRNRTLRRIMPDSVIEEADASNLPDAKRAIVRMLESRNIWNTVQKCKSPEDMHRLLWRCTYINSSLSTTLERSLREALKHDYVADTTLRETLKHDAALLSRIVRKEVGNIAAFGTSMFALGIIRGMQFGRELDSKTQGNINLLLRHAPVRRLLLEEPKASNLKICRALDKVERMPSSKGVWSDLNKQYGTWEKAAGEQSVRTLITHARRVALQDAIYQEFLSVADGVGDEGSITNKFRPKKYAGLVKSK